MIDPRRRGPGRPPLDPRARQPSANVHIRLSARDYDEVDRLAKRRRETIQDLIRGTLKRLIDGEHA